MYNAPVLKKGIEILRLITQTKEPLGVSEVARRLSIVKSTALGILKALEEEGLVAQDPVTRKYVPGRSLYEFCREALRSMELPAVAKPFLEEAGGTGGRNGDSRGEGRGQYAPRPRR